MKRIKIILTIAISISLSILCSCGRKANNSGSTQDPAKVETALPTTTKKIPDTISFTYQVDAYAEMITLTKNGDLYYARLQGDTTTRPLLRIPYHDTGKLKKILMSVPQGIFALKQPLTLGRPYDFDQGGYCIRVVLKDRPAYLINIDPDLKTWPQEDGTFIKNLMALYKEISNGEKKT